MVTIFASVYTGISPTSSKKTLEVASSGAFVCPIGNT